VQISSLKKKHPAIVTITLLKRSHSKFMITIPSRLNACKNRNGCAAYKNTVSIKKYGDIHFKCIDFNILRLKASLIAIAPA
jgi:hypothetical protein